MPSKETTKKARNPLILRCHRLMEAFAKSDEERDFYLDKVEGFIVFADLSKEEDALVALYKELASDPDRYRMIPKMSFYEAKKIMENFVHEKVYDIDIKEKLMDIIQGKDARETFLEFLYDHELELDKWQQFYQERARIRIIEWLRNEKFDFVFEEDLDLACVIVEQLKQNLFQPRVSTELQRARKIVEAKAKVYYKDEALNPRPKRGRPPKQTNKIEIEPQVTADIYQAVPSSVRSFLFTPDITAVSGATFSSKYDSEEELLASLRNQGRSTADATLANLNDKLATLRTMSSHWLHEGEGSPAPASDWVSSNGADAAEPPKRTPAKTPKASSTKTSSKAAEKAKPAAKKPAKSTTTKKKSSSTTTKTAAKKAPARRTLKRTGTKAETTSKKKAPAAAGKRKTLTRLRTTKKK